jgi:hypothetical protein
MRKDPVFHGGVSMIYGDASCSHGINEFFSKVVGFGAVLQTYSNLVAGQKADVLFAVDICAGRCFSRIVIWRPLNPELRKMTEVRPCVGLAEQLDAPVQYHLIPESEVRLKEPEASTEIVDGSNGSVSYRRYSWPRQASTIGRMQNAVGCVRIRVKSPFRSVELSNKPFPNRMRAEMGMPGRFNREPELGAVEPEQFVTWIVQHK